MYINRTFTYDLDGKVTVTETLWTKDDFVQAIADIENEITPRRVREALFDDTAKQWIEDKNNAIAVLRNDMAKI